MKGIGAWILALVGLWLATGLQAMLASRIGIYGASPDFVLTLLSCLCLFSTRTTGAVLGFIAGVMTGAVVGANMTQYVFSRTIAGFCDSWSRNLGLDPNYLTAAVNAFAVTVVAQLILMFFAPPPGITSFVGATIASALVNGVLAVPVFALLRRVLGS